MRKAFIPAFLLVLGSVVLGATVLREPIARATAPITSVLVTNDAAHPVPVHEQGTANVNVTNSQLSVQAAGNPVVFDVGENFVGGPFGGYTVPAGRRLVINYVNGRATDVGAELTLTNGSNVENYYFAGTPTAGGDCADSSDPCPAYIFGQQVQIIASAGDVISVTPHGFETKLTVTGYLE